MIQRTFKKVQRVERKFKCSKTSDNLKKSFYKFIKKKNFPSPALSQNYLKVNNHSNHLNLPRKSRKSP